MRPLVLLPQPHFDNIAANRVVMSRLEPLVSKLYQPAVKLKVCFILTHTHTHTHTHRTMLGRGRAWLRFVLMQKKLADSFRTMVEGRTMLR